MNPQIISKISNVIMHIKIEDEKIEFMSSLFLEPIRYLSNACSTVNVIKGIINA